MIGKTEGMGPNGLYKGIQAAWLIALSYSTMNLALYEPIRYLLTKTFVRPEEDVPSWVKFGSGALSGFCTAALTNPACVLKIKMQS